MKFRNYIYDRNLISDSMQQLLDLTWQSHRDLKEGDPTDGWKTIPDQEFFKFLEISASKNLSSQSSNSTIEDMYRVIRAGLIFDPMDPVGTLEQLTFMLNNIKKDGVKLTKDDLTLSHMKFRNCSPVVKQSATVLKTTLGPPLETYGPFYLLRQMLSKVKSVMNDAEGLLDWIDITAFAALRRPSLLIDKHVPNGNPSNPAKPTPNKPNGNPEKDKKRERDIKATP